MDELLRRAAGRCGGDGAHGVHLLLAGREGRRPSEQRLRRRPLRGVLRLRLHLGLLPLLYALNLFWWGQICKAIARILSKENQARKDGDKED